MTDYVIIGNGVAGTTSAEHIRRNSKDASITVVSDEDLPFYYRIRLNEYISQDISEQSLIARYDKWYKDLDIRVKLNTRIVDGDVRKKFIISNNGERLKYDILLIAAGSSSFFPPISGSDKRGVFAVRSIKDAREISSYAKNATNVVIIGGGLLGLEAGNALRKIGKEVKVVEFFPRLLPRQLDIEGAKRLQAIMEEMGFSFRLGARTKEITGEEKVGGIILESGEELRAEMVIVSAGVRPNVELAKSLGIDHDKGIKVDDHLRSSTPDVFAAGDVAEFNGFTYGIWPAAMEQGRIAGINMAGGDSSYAGTTMANTLKVVGIDLASAGDIDAEGRHESKVISDEKVYKKVAIKDEKIAGCIMLGETKGFDKITRAIFEKKEVSQVRDLLRSAGFNME